MNLGEAEQVVAIAGSIAEALETDDAAKAGDEEPDVSVVGRPGLRCDGVVVERWQAASHHVDDPGVGGCAEMGLFDQVLGAAIAAAASSSGSGAVIGPFHGPQQAGGL